MARQTEGGEEQQDSGDYKLTGRGKEAADAVTLFHPLLVQRGVSKTEIVSSLPTFKALKNVLDIVLRPINDQL